MAHTFVISDTHFGHKNICNFLRDDGSKLRPWTNPDEMDQFMIDKWNSVVQPGDKVYHLGDVVINRKAMSIMHALNGKKVLIKGNHDLFKLADYTPHFYDIRACHVLDKCILTHIPIHELSFGRFRGNIHGHLHDRRVPDRYQSVCVEQINYTPVEFSEVVNRFPKRDVIGL
jgi:calcineurin-like phosphoesterase family protein